MSYPPSGLLTAEHLTGLDFPVVIHADDGAMVFCSTTNDVFHHFEPQDLCDPAHFGWDSLGRRFSFEDWDSLGDVTVEEASSWDVFDAVCAAAYRTSPDVARWRARPLA